MRRPPVWGSPGAFGSAARTAVITLALALGCRRADGPPDGSPVRSVVVTVAQPQILVGATTQATAKLIDADGNEVTDRVPFWLSATPSILRVSEDGEVTGLQAGTGQVRASSGSVSAGATITVRNAVAATIQLAQTSATVQLPGGSFQAIATVIDEIGRPMVNPAITWTSQHPLIASVNVSGLVTGVASGNAAITASIDNISATLVVHVRPSTAAGAPTIVTVTPPTLRPGGTYTLTGTNFAPQAGANQVMVDGLSSNVLTASATQLTISLPTTGFACEPSRDAVLQVSAGGLLGAKVTPLQAANRRALAVGQSVVVTDVDEVRCNEIVPATGRWLVSIYNASRAQVTPASTANAQIQVRGVPPTEFATSLTTSTLVAAMTGRSLAPLPAASSPHLDLLERNIRGLRGVPTRPAPASIVAGPGGGPKSDIATLNAITAVKIPNLDAADLCVSNFPVHGRTAFVSEHAVIVEDTVSVFNGKTTLRGQMDDYFLRLGMEFEQVIWPIISGSFGNPLAMDPQLNNVGRVVMVFSPRVNAMRAGSITGFVASCDFFPASQRPSSNGGAFFYASVPTSSAQGYTAPESRDHWLRSLRSTVIHEVKHLTSFAERLSRNLPAEELSWEEGSARIAEEIFSRAVYGTVPLSNTGYAPTIGCDLKYELAVALCADRPLLMLRHFDALYTYLAAPEVYSPLGRATPNDVNFYAGAWSVLRWVSENAAPNEDAFFSDFTTSAAVGAANLELRTGRRWEEMLGEWSLAAYLDDVAGFAPQNLRLRMRSWNHPDIWRGLCSDLGPCLNPSNPAQLYLRPTPFSPRQRTYGNFQFVVATLIGGGVSYLDLDGAGFASQAIEIKSATGNGDAPGSVRIAFVRVR
jgi:uncharacterized protein YjdB